MARSRRNRFDTPVPKWPRESLRERLLTCITMLVVHGVMTDGEKAKVRGRLVGQWRKEAAKLAATEGS